MRLAGLATLVLLAGAVPGPGPGAGPPSAVTVSTPRGETRIAVRQDVDGAPRVAASSLARALGGDVQARGPWLDLELTVGQFRLLVGTPFYRIAGAVGVLAAPTLARADTVWLPLQVMTEALPAKFSARYHYDGPRATFTEIGGPNPAPARYADRLPNGLLPGHLVVVDPGHGGSDPGNPGRFFPKGVQEKHVTLQIGLKLRTELEQRGVGVRMTRTTDVRPSIFERAPMCNDGCDLFVSLHVDALPSSRRNYQSVRGFHTIIIGEKNSADASRVARMENESLRYEVEDGSGAVDDALAFILKDMSRNEYLRESAQVASLVQSNLAKVHGGENLGVRQTDRLAVLNTAVRPAMLVEMGYATNRQDAQFMVSESGQRKIARAIADAIVEYLKSYERRTGEVPLVGAGR